MEGLTIKEQAKKSKPNVVSTTTARTQFDRILERVENNQERIIIDRRGEPTVIIMSVRDYIDTMAPGPDWLKDIQADARKKGLNKLSMRKIDALIAEVRQEQRKPSRSKPTK